MTRVRLSEGVFVIRTVSTTLCVLFLGACAATDTVPGSNGGLLCIEKTDGTGDVVHCLNPLSADPAAVEERVALFNAVNDKKDHIGCTYRQRLGSRFTRWRCHYIHRPDANGDPDVDRFLLIDKGTTRK